MHCDTREMHPIRLELGLTQMPVIKDEFREVKSLKDQTEIFHRNTNLYTLEILSMSTWHIQLKPDGT